MTVDACRFMNQAFRGVEAPHPALRATLSRGVQHIDIPNRCLRTSRTVKVKSSSREKTKKVIAFVVDCCAGVRC